MRDDKFCMKTKNLLNIIIVLFFISACTVSSSNRKITSTGSNGSSSGTSSSSSGSGEESSVIASISNEPTGTNSDNTLNVTVGGTDVQYYKYKVGTGSLDCQNSSAYSAAIAVTVPITDSLASISDGTVKICVIGGIDTITFTDLASSTSVTWTKDTTAPTAASSIVLGAQFASTAGTTTPTITWTNGVDSGSGVASHEVKIVDSNSNSDISSYSVHTKGTAITGLSLQPGKYKFKIKATDNLGFSSESSSADFVICPTNYVYIPSLSPFTSAGFCVMKWEAKNSGGTAISQASGVPDSNILLSTAVSRCSNNGSKYDLISNSEWMSIARNIESVGSNWSGGAVKSGFISMGHYNSSSTDLCDGSYEYSDWSPSCVSASGDFEYKRTHTLNTGEVIWDMGGNALEFIKSNMSLPLSGSTGVSDEFFSNEPANFNNAGWSTDDGVSGTIKSIFGPTSTDLSGCTGWGSYHCGMGRAGVNWIGEIIVRGGGVRSGGGGGIFSVFTYHNSPDTDIDFGYRCVYHP